MRITQGTVEKLAAEIKRQAGRNPVESICHPGDGRTHYVMAESMISTYYGARQATAYLLGILISLDPAGLVHAVENQPDWIREIDDAFDFGNIPDAQMTAYQAGRDHGQALRTRHLPTPRGYAGVEHDDGTVHAIDLDKLHDDRPLWRETPVCGRATGVSSDEGGPSTLHRRTLTCTDCIAILA